MFLFACFVWGRFGPGLVQLFGVRYGHVPLPSGNHFRFQHRGSRLGLGLCPLFVARDLLRENGSPEGWEDGWRWNTTSRDKDKDKGGLETFDTQIPIYSEGGGVMELF